MGTFLGFDPGLSHLVEAGADFFLMPSRYEPCGLNQMYSLRYGTVPIVRATGGLVDTVEGGLEGNGILFEAFHPAALLAAMRRAQALYAEPARLLAVPAPGHGEGLLLGRLRAQVRSALHRPHEGIVGLQPKAR